jgi:hypothetical protein
MNKTKLVKKHITCTVNVPIKKAVRNLPGKNIFITSFGKFHVCLLKNAPAIKTQ